MPAVTFDKVDVVFGEAPQQALALIDRGASREAILKQTGQVVGVRDASLDVEAGEIVVLMGLSGSGKSTLLRCVNGLNKVSRGRVLVRDGESQIDIAACDAATLRRLRMNRIAMVFQQFALLPWRTVQENVGFGLELRGMPRAERDRLVADKLKLVQLDQWRDKHVHELSGGMQQRVGLARAFATDADVLLMDEPFSALDPLIREHLQDELLDLQHGLRKTIIFVSHDLDEALKIGNHIAILEGGNIVQFGRPEEIVLTPASDYVAQFVANMNPLNVLRGGSLMRPLAELRRDGDTVMLDDQGRRRCTLDRDGRPLSGQDGEVPCRVVAADGDTPPEPGVLLTAPTNLLMRRAIELHNATGAPLLLLDDAGRLTGVVGTDQLLAGLLPRRNAQSS